MCLQTYITSTVPAVLAIAKICKFTRPLLWLQVPQSLALTPTLPPTPGPVFAPVFSPTFNAPSYMPPMQPTAGSGSGLFMQGPDGNFYPVQPQGPVAAPMMAMARQQSMFNPAQWYPPNLASPRMMMARQPSMFGGMPAAVGSPRMTMPAALGSPRMAMPRQHSIFYQPPPPPAVQSQAVQDPAAAAAAAAAPEAAREAAPEAAVSPVAWDRAAQIMYPPEPQQPMFDPAQMFAPLPDLYDPTQGYGAAAPFYMPNQAMPGYSPAGYSPAGFSPAGYSPDVDPSANSWSQLPGPSQVGT